MNKVFFSLIRFLEICVIKAETYWHINIRDTESNIVVFKLLHDCCSGFAARFNKSHSVVVDQK